MLVGVLRCIRLRSTNTTSTVATITIAGTTFIAVLPVLPELECMCDSRILIWLRVRYAGERAELERTHAFLKQTHVPPLSSTRPDITMVPLDQASPRELAG